MRHVRINTAAYLIWVEARPSFNGKGKDVYYEAVRKTAREEIQIPITSSDIELEIIYSTATKPAERLDADNVNKPTLDALKGVAYTDDRQVRHVESTVFDRSTVNHTTVQGRVEHIGRLFYTPHPHVVLILVYSDSRLKEMGGEPVVQRQRYERWNRDFNNALAEATSAAARASEDEFVPSAGVYREPSTGHYVCPRCRADNKRSLLVNGREGFSCPVCSGYFHDNAREGRSGFADDGDGGPQSWMS